MIRAWLIAAGFVSAASFTINTDISGTWLIKLTDLGDSSSEVIVAGVKSRRSALRIPAAGETTEASNTVYPVSGATTNHRGWALTRDLGLRYLDDLVTSGAVQIFYLNDASILGGGINAGTPLALVQGGTTVLFPGTVTYPPYNVPIRVPQVQLAQADLTNNKYAYVGLLKAGRSSDTGDNGSWYGPSFRRFIWLYDPGDNNWEFRMGYLFRSSTGRGCYRGA